MRFNAGLRGPVRMKGRLRNGGNLSRSRRCCDHATVKCRPKDAWLYPHKCHKRAVLSSGSFCPSLPSSADQTSHNWPARSQVSASRARLSNVQADLPVTLYFVHNDGLPGVRAALKKLRVYYVGCAVLSGHSNMGCGRGTNLTIDRAAVTAFLVVVSEIGDRRGLSVCVRFAVQLIND